MINLRRINFQKSSEETRISQRNERLKTCKLNIRRRRISLSLPLRSIQIDRPVFLIWKFKIRRRQKWRTHQNHHKSSLKHKQLWMCSNLDQIQWENLKIKIWKCNTFSHEAPKNWRELITDQRLWIKINQPINQKHCRRDRRVLNASYQNVSIWSSC